MAYKAFISSTYIDLKDHRARVIEALENVGFFVDPMEKWTADSDEPKAVSVDRVQNCDLCILLVAARRGHVPTGETSSITQLEYAEAVRYGIDVIAFLYDGKSAWPPEYYELKEDKELQAWRAELMEHRCVGTFTTDPTSLDTTVRDALARWIQKQDWPEIRLTYLETLRDANASIRFLGIGQYQDLQDQSIESLYVDPRTGAQHISPDTPPDQWPETESLIDDVIQHQRLVLLGDPGSGKSTLVSWIVWNLAREGKNPWKQALGHLTPIVMVLRELSLERVQSWNDLLAAYFQHWTSRLLGRPRYAEDVHKLLREGQAFILLDGLDEIGSMQVQMALRKAVWEGMQTWDGCRWLLTSRVIGYLNYHESEDPEQADLERERIEYAKLRYVAPFMDGQITQFAKNWFASRDQSALRARQNAERLIDAIHANPYTLRLARIPNLLTMMALIHRERARLPHGRALLYTDIAQAYLQSIDEHRRIERLGYSLRDQKEWLGRIGFEMQRRRRDQRYVDSGTRHDILASSQEVRQWVQQAMRDSGRKESSDEAVDAFLDEICRRSGLLLPRGEDQFAFTHLSFQEFFAAVFLLPQFMLPQRRIKKSRVEGASPEDLRTYVGSSEWQETLIFLTELVAAEQPHWLEDLLYNLFGEAFCDVTAPLEVESNKPSSESERFREQSRAMLLAQLALDPHAGFDESGLKWDAICCCCERDVNVQKKHKIDIRRDSIMSITNSVTSTALSVLPGADGGDQNRIWQCFVSALHDSDIQALSLRRIPIQDILPLTSLVRLEVLYLEGTQVSDVSALSSLTSLEVLYLRGTQVSDVSALSSLTSLEVLYLRGTQVSEHNARQLKESLPRCSIVFL